MRVEELQNLVVSSKVLEDLLGVSDRMIRYMAEEGILERDSHGKYRFMQSVKNYITTLKIAGSKKTAELNGETLDLDAERAIHERYKRQITEIKLQLIQGRVHRAEDVEAVMTDMLERFKAKIVSMPVKLAKRLEGENCVSIQEILEEEMHDALEELAGYNPSDFYSEEHIDVKEDVISRIVNEVSNERCGMEDAAPNERAGQDTKTERKTDS